MPQRHHQGHKRTPKQLALIIKRCLPMVLTGSGMLCTTANAEEYYFDPIMLETTKSGMQTTDLSRFSKKYAQLPGTYQVDIWLNKKKVSQKKITFTANAEQLLQPQFTVEQLRELGIKVDEIPALAEKDDDSVINSLEQIIPGTAAEFDFNHQQLNLSIPQIALYRDARGYVSPSRWDDGIPTLFTNYSFTGSDNRYRQGNRSQRQYLNMQNGANFGPWRLRNYSTWTRNDQTSSRVSYQMTSQKDRPTQHEMRLDGSLLDDGRLSYSLEQSLDDDNNHNSSLNASYRSPYGTFSAGYSYGNDSSQYNYGVTGGVVIHPHGVTLSQYLGNAFALIDANGASGVRIQNYPGIATDPFGYAVVPYLTTYQENRLSVDTTQLPDNVDLEQTTQFVVPNRGAMVAARFNANIGYRVLVTVSDRNGKPLPFGALASNDDTGQQSIVDEGGILYLSGISSKSQSWTVRWGNQADQQCQFAFSTPDSEPTTSVLQGTAQCH
ncbi:fimbrial biogenesis outer membrane usher protein [Escherichia coli]|nr:fimbrial biogenesis outer membrane usher protein [Escherichia coli]